MIAWFVFHCKRDEVTLPLLFMFQSCHTLRQSLFRSCFCPFKKKLFLFLYTVTMGVWGGRGGEPGGGVILLRNVCAYQ